MFFTVILAASFASVVDLVGLAVLRSARAKKLIYFLLAFAAGVLLSAAFLDLLPEGLERGGSLIWVLGGFVLFYLLEKGLVLYHCHDEGCDVHTGSYLMAIGDSLHDFLDGVIIAIAFLVSKELGLVAALAVALHEIPSGFGTLSVILSGSPTKKFIWTYVIASTIAAPLGAGLAFWAGSAIAPALAPLLLLIAGGFIYIAAVDLVPEMHKEFRRLNSAVQLTLFLLGIASSYWVGWIFGVN
ncbi:MAG: ZIP family metal transporter [Patescibacteria group bacterium]|nr:MAG: ZIP family metal transporter [Patescibacteria group bacterium]